MRVNVVSAGPIATPLYGKLGLSPTDLASMKDYLHTAVPVGRFGDPREFADAVVYLASDEGRFTVAAELILDCGMSNI